MILEMLLHLVALDLGYFVGLITGNIFLVFGISLALYYRLEAKNIPKLLIGWVAFLGLMDIVALLGWKYLPAAMPFETLIFVGITAPILINKTVLEKHGAAVSVILLLGGSLFVSL